MGEPFRFGPFEFDAGSGELRRLDGTSPVQRLPPQPARLLELLAERRGAVVSREDIRERLWPDTHVDFDASLHFCIRQVRAALDDSAAEPRYVENVPRRGYRLIPETARVSSGVGTREPAAIPKRRRVWLLVVPAVLVVLIGAASAYYFAERATPAPPVRIGIMPFKPPANMPGFDPWRPIAEWILEDLTSVAGPSAAIVGPTTTTAYGGSDDGLRSLAGDYRLQYIVNGRFINDKSGPRMLGELIRVSDGAHIWVRGYSDVSDGQRIGQEISRNVASMLKLGSH